MNIMQKSNVRVMLTSCSDHIVTVYEIYLTKNMLLLHSCKECALYLKFVSIWIVYKNLFFKSVLFLIQLYSFIRRPLWHFERK